MAWPQNPSSDRSPDQLLPRQVPKATNGDGLNGRGFGERGRMGCETSRANKLEISLLAEVVICVIPATLLAGKGGFAPDVNKARRQATVVSTTVARPRQKLPISCLGPQPHGMRHRVDIRVEASTCSMTPTPTCRPAGLRHRHTGHSMQAMTP